MFGRSAPITRVALILCISLTWLLALALPAQAATDDVAVIAQAWYWEAQQNQNVDTPVGNVSGELPNPFCPSVPGSIGSDPSVCAEGRLPVEVVQGDYEAPDKVSAVAFDFSFVPIGSDIQKFTLTLLEAESGCRPNEDSQTGQKCENTDSQNVDGKQVRACEATEIFGDAEARPYKEMPKFDCATSAVSIERKEIKNDAEADPADPDPDHVWVWDLTALAKKWAGGTALCTCILLRPEEPKEADQDDNLEWRVVFAGPKFPGGVEAKLKYTPAEGELVPPPTTPPPPGGGTGSGGLGSTTTTTTSGDFGTSPGGGLGSEAPDAPTEGDVAAPEDAGTDEGTELASAEGTPVEAMPGYVWLALIAGVVGWSMVRSIVVDRVTGHRPDGVLAQIHRLNASRAGAAAVAAPTGGPLHALRSGFGSIGRALRPATEKVGAVAGKLARFKRG